MLPERPSLEQLKKQAKEQLANGTHASLAEAQHALAQHHGFTNWAALKRAVELTTLRRLIEDGDPAPVRAFIEASPSLVNEMFDDRMTPLHVAAGENRPAIVEVLVRAGASHAPRIGDSSHTALSWALTTWSMEAARALADLGADVDLFCAAGLGDVARLETFWQDGRLVPRPSRTGSSRTNSAGERLPSPPTDPRDVVSDALYLACRCNQLDAARVLLDHGADPNFRGYEGATCLAWAEFSGNPALTALLRERGGDDTIVDHTFLATPKVFALMTFVAWGFPHRLAAALQADPSQVNARGGHGTLLHVAAYNGREASVRILRHFGADLHALSTDGLTPLQVAQRRHPALSGLLE